MGATLGAIGRVLRVSAALREARYCLRGIHLISFVKSRVASFDQNGESDHLSLSLSLSLCAVKLLASTMIGAGATPD
jgi:hypothetical protein